MRVVLAALLAALPLTGALAEGEPIPRRGESASVTFPTAGCAETADTRKFVVLMADGDQTAAMKFVLRKGDQCQPFTKGLQVAVEDVSVLNGMACVRQRGEPDCRWIPFGFLKAAEKK